MNKQEAKQKLHNIAFAKMNARPDDLKLADVMQVIDQIHEPQKVTLPKFVAEWIKKCKDMNYSLRDAMKITNLSTKLNVWFLKRGQDMFSYPNQEIFARAWYDGYEIEQEKLYTVEIPNPNDNEITVLERTANGVVLAQFGRHEDNWKKERVYCLTESEIKQDFEWAWDAGFYEPVEVE